MPSVSPRKRPCCICRKWFLPDVRQKDRQKTCDDPECRKEHHRRQCAKWNHKNRQYFKSNYLAKKLEKVGKPSGAVCMPPSGPPVSVLPGCRINPILPRDVVLREVPAKNLIIIEYLAEQLMGRKRIGATGFS